MSMAGSHQRKLEQFTTARAFRGKGPLSVALVVTEHARKMGLPLDPEHLVTDGGGQVLGLGKGAVQAILKRHGITRVLASEGGRTSRGSLNNMREYVAFLNTLGGPRNADLDAVEAFWIQRVHEFFFWISIGDLLLGSSTAGELRAQEAVRLHDVADQVRERHLCRGRFEAVLVRRHLLRSLDEHLLPAL